MKQEWLGLREFARRCGRTHRAAQKAIEDGRIPAAAVRRNEKGHIHLVDLHLASMTWHDHTDLDQALRSTAAPIRTPLPGAVQTSAPPPKKALTAYDDAFGGACYPAYETAFLHLPGVLARAGLGTVEIESMLNELQGVMRSTLESYGEHQLTIDEFATLLRYMLDEERRHPGSWSK